MGTIYAKKGVLYVGFKDAAGKWVYRSSGRPVGDEAGAAKVLRQVELEVQRLGLRATAPDTVGAYFDQWIQARYARQLTSARDDEQRVRDYVLPVFSREKLTAVTTRQVRALMVQLRLRGTLAPRTLMNIYGAMHRLFADAAAEELIDRNPCALTRGELPGKVDKDRTWRATAVYAREEVEKLISGALELDRRMLFGLAGLAGLREGEIAALRWRDVDQRQPLNALLVHSSFTRRNKRVKSTKTGRSRQVPVHPELAKLLAEWKLTGWAAQFGHAPRLDDLVLPNRAGRMLTDLNVGDAVRTSFIALGLRKRRFHDLRRTFISLAIADGARKDVLRWVTHGPEGDVIDLYTTLPWKALCEAVEMLRLEARGVTTPLLLRASSAGEAADPTRVAGVPRAGLEASPVETARTQQSVTGTPEDSEEPPEAVRLSAAEELRRKVVRKLARAAELGLAGENISTDVRDILKTLQVGR